MLMILGIYMYMCGVISFCLVRKHLLSLLLSLEFIVLSLYFILVNCLIGYEYEYFFLMIFLTFSVCEGALGLGLLVSMIRAFGNDYFQVFSVLW